MAARRAYASTSRRRSPGVIHTAAMYFDPANQLRMPNWTRMDIGARYRTKLNNQAVVLRAGWLGLKTEPFKGWQSAHILSVTGSNGDDRVFEVKRNFNNPVQEDDWLWFPAMPQKVEPFRN